MTKTHFINNTIALFAYALSVAVNWQFLSRILFLMSYVIPLNINFMYVAIAASVLHCIVIGFALKPVDRFPLLSLVSIPVLIFLLIRGGDLSLAYYNCNPIASLIPLLFVGLPHASYILVHTLLILAAAIPSLLVYAGMMLRKRFVSCDSSGSI